MHYYYITIPSFIIIIAQFKCDHSSSETQRCSFSGKIIIPETLFLIVTVYYKHGTSINQTHASKIIIAWQILVSSCIKVYLISSCPHCLFQKGLMG